MEERCRHFSAHKALFAKEKACALGVDIRAQVVEANGGNTLNISRMFPCRPGPLKKVDCENYSPKTEVELAEEWELLQAKMNRMVVALPVIMTLRRDMRLAGVRVQNADCAFCGAAGTMRASCNSGHISCSCSACGEGFLQ